MTCLKGIKSRLDFCEYMYCLVVVGLCFSSMGQFIFFGQNRGEIIFSKNLPALPPCLLMVAPLQWNRVQAVYVVFYLGRKYGIHYFFKQSINIQGLLKYISNYFRNVHQKESLCQFFNFCNGGSRVQCVIFVFCYPLNDSSEIVSIYKLPIRSTILCNLWTNCALLYTTDFPVLSLMVCANLSSSSNLFGHESIFFTWFKMNTFLLLMISEITWHRSRAGCFENMHCSKPHVSKWILLPLFSSMSMP